MSQLSVGITDRRGIVLKNFLPYSINTLLQGDVLDAPGNITLQMLDKIEKL